MPADPAPTAAQGRDDALAALCEATPADVRGFLLGVLGVPWRVCPVCGKSAADHQEEAEPDA